MMAESENQSALTDEAMYEEAVRLRDADRHAEALPLFEVLARNSPHEGHLLLLSLCQSDLEQWEDAEASALEVLELNPESWVAWRQLGMLLDRRGRSAEAISPFERSLGLRDNPNTRALYASLLLKSGDVDGARKQLHACTCNFPDDPEAWFRLGSTWENDDPERALRLMQSALEIYPEWGHYHAGVAFMHAVLAHVDDARHHQRVARRLGSDDPEFEGMLESTSRWLLRIDGQLHPRKKPRPE